MVQKQVNLVIGNGCGLPSVQFKWWELQYAPERPMQFQPQKIEISI